MMDHPGIDDVPSDGDGSSNVRALLRKFTVHCLSKLIDMKTGKSAGSGASMQEGHTLKNINSLYIQGRPF